jgi:hypothetical protein
MAQQTGFALDIGIAKRKNRRFQRDPQRAAASSMVTFNELPGDP